MKHQLIHTTVLLQTLITLLSEEGIDVNTSAALNIEKVLLNTDLTVYNTFSKLKYRIVPILGRNKEEQDIIYKLFDGKDEKLKYEESHIQPPDTKAPQFIYAPKKDVPENWFSKLKQTAKTPWFWVGVVLLVSAVASIIFWSNATTPNALPAVNIVADKSSVVVGDTVHFTAQFSDSTMPHVAGIVWMLPDTIISKQLSVAHVFRTSGNYEIIAVISPPGSRIADTAAYPVTVLCEPPPAVTISKSAVRSANGQTSVRRYIYTPQFTNASKDSARYKYHWYANNQPISTDKILEYKNKAIGNNEIKLVVDCKGIHCSTDSLTYILQEQSPLSVSVTGYGDLVFRPRYNWVIIDKALFWLLFTVILPAILLYRWLKPASGKKKEVKPEEPGAPYAIQFNNQDHHISIQKEISQLADILRKRQVSEVLKLNIRKTIQATVRTGGLPTLAFVPLTKPSDYLVFVESSDDNIHVERLFKYLLAKLETEQVNLTVYEYRKEPLFLSNERLNHYRIPVDRIAALYPERTLIILGDAKNFVLPLKNILKPWVTDKLNNWRTKIIITPSPTNDWDKKEQLLIAAHYTLIPADLNANTIIEKIINGTIDNQLEATFNIPQTYSANVYNFQEFDALQHYLANEQLLKWVCSLAVYPTIDWNLTLAIGKKLETENACKGQPVELVNYSNLLKIGRISWLQDGSISHTLRIEMLKYLDNETEALARQTLVEQLSELEQAISQTSLVKREYEVHKTINQFLLHAYTHKNPTSKEEAFIKEILAENQLDGAHEIYLNSSADTLLKNPFKKTKSVQLSRYFKAVHAKRKLVAAAVMLVAVAVYVVILKISVGDKWKIISPSPITFHINTGNVATGGLQAVIHTADTTLTINLDQYTADTTLTYNPDQDSGITTQLYVKDTATSTRITISTNTGQLLTQDSFKLNFSTYSVQLSEAVPIPVNIFYKNTSDAMLANRLEEELPTSFEVTIGQQNFSDTALRVTYASAPQKKDAELVQTITANVLARMPKLVERNYSSIKSVQNRDTIFEPLPIAVYISSAATCTPVSLPNTIYGTWEGALNNRTIDFNLAGRFIKYNTGGNNTFGLYSINEVCLQKNGLYRVITSTTSGYKLFFVKNLAGESFDLAVCPVFYKTKEELSTLSDEVCGVYDRMKKQQAVIKKETDTPVSTTPKDTLVPYNASAGLTPTLREEYQKLYDQCSPTKEKLSEVNTIINKILNNRSRYEQVASATGVPWNFIGILHSIEDTLNFKDHLHNGDPLTSRTVNVPKGRPKSGNPPFTWEESAIDALTMAGLNSKSEWSITGILYSFEKYNGMGYRTKNINSPYLWAGSNNYTKGAFMVDGVFDPNAVMGKVGAGVLLKAMDERNMLNNKSAAQQKY